MARIPKTPEDFYWKSGSKDVRAAMQFLIDTRNYVANIEIPNDYSFYRQIAHSDDEKIPGGDPNRPAVLDASYDHMAGKRLSISLPIFTPAQEAISFTPHRPTLSERFKKLLKPDTKIPKEDIKVNTGFHGPALQECFLLLLNHYGIQHDTPKIGYYTPEMTAYIETTLEHPERDFDKGRRIIQAFVHGNAETPEQLMADIQRVLPKGNAPGVRLG